MSSALSKLDALKAAFDKKGTVSDGDQNWKLFYRFWKIPDDSRATIRFLPDLDPDNSLGFLVENLQHQLTVNGERKFVACLQMYGKKCPICELSRHYYDEKDDVRGKHYYRKKSYIGQIIVIESPIEHDQQQLVKLIDFGPAVFKQIQAAFQSGDLEEAPYEFKGGYNFRIIKSKNGQYASYATSSFAPKQTDLEDDILEGLTLFNLADFRAKEVDLAEVEALLLADQTGRAYSTESAEAPKDEAPKTKTETKSEAPKTETKSEAAPEKAPEQEKGTSKSASAILEQLRAKARASKAAE